MKTSKQLSCLVKYRQNIDKEHTMFHTNCHLVLVTFNNMDAHLFNHYVNIFTTSYIPYHRINDNANGNDIHVFDVMATGPKSTYVTIHISKKHVTVCTKE